MDEIEERIRLHAFLLWEKAGRPDGRSEEFWHEARDVELGQTQPSEREIDQAEKDSFPASDPASFAGF